MRIIVFAALLCGAAGFAGGSWAQDEDETNAEPPPHITGIRNESVTYRQAAFLHCQTQSIEQARITWLRSGYQVGNSAKFYASPHGTLRIRDVTHEDAGPYTCRATTSGGRAEATVYLSVFALPSARIHPKSLHIVEGVTFNLTCYVDGYPMPEPIWFFKGNRLYPDAKYKIAKNELSVRGATRHDAGMYECRAVNPAGIKTDYATVQLAGTLKTKLLRYAAVAVCAVVAIAVVCTCALVFCFECSSITHTHGVEVTVKDGRVEERIDWTRHTEFRLGDLRRPSSAE